VTTTAATGEGRAPSPTTLYATLAPHVGHTLDLENARPVYRGDTPVLRLRCLYPCEKAGRTLRVEWEADTLKGHPNHHVALVRLGAAWLRVECTTCQGRPILDAMDPSVAWRIGRRVEPDDFPRCPHGTHGALCVTCTPEEPMKLVVSRDPREGSTA
jgi:hypothetical protein